MHDQYIMQPTNIVMYLESPRGQIRQLALRSLPTLAVGSMVLNCIYHMYETCMHRFVSYVYSIFVRYAYSLQCNSNQKLIV